MFSCTPEFFFFQITVDCGVVSDRFPSYESDPRGDNKEEKQTGWGEWDMGCDSCLLWEEVSDCVLVSHG